MQVPSGSTTPLSTLIPGDPFYFNSEYYVKTDQPNGTNNVTRLSTGLLISLPEASLVTPIALRATFAV